MTIGDKIKSFRILKGMSQKTLADISGVSEGSIRKYEAGTRNPKKEQLKKLVAALEITEAALFSVDSKIKPIETLGDAFALYFELEKALGVSYITDPKDEIALNRIELTFESSRFNSYLRYYIPLRKLLDDTIESGDKYESEEDHLTHVKAMMALVEYTRNDLIKNDMLIGRHELDIEKYEEEKRQLDEVFQ